MSRRRARRAQERKGNRQPRTGPKKPSKYQSKQNGPRYYSIKPARTTVITAEEGAALKELIEARYDNHTHT